MTVPRRINPFGSVGGFKKKVKRTTRVIYVDSSICAYFHFIISLLRVMIFVLQNDYKDFVSVMNKFKNRLPGFVLLQPFRPVRQFACVITE